MGQREGHQSVTGLCTLAMPYKMPGREPQGYNEDKEFIKTRLKDSAFTSFRSYNCNSGINLTKNERLALNNLSNNKNIIIQKSDKGNSVVLLDKDKYLEGMSKILNNSAKFEMLQFDHDKKLDYILNLQTKSSMF